jgi:hypothetical protein
VSKALRGASVRVRRVRAFFFPPRNTKGNMPNLVTCRCQHCNGKLEFDPATLAEENKRITCPLCGLETILFMPPPPEISRLINCPACNVAVSPATPRCPHCGHPISIHKDREILVERIVKVVVLVVVLGVGLFFIIKGSREWEDAIRQGIVDRDNYSQVEIGLSNDLRDIQLDASNNAAIHLKQMQDSDAEREAARKLKDDMDAAHNHQENMAILQNATEHAVAAHIRLLVAMGMIIPELGDAEIPNSSKFAQAFLNVETKSSVEIVDIEGDLLEEHLHEKQEQLITRIHAELKANNELINQAAIDRKVKERLAQHGLTDNASVADLTDEFQQRLSEPKYKALLAKAAKQDAEK